MKVLGFFPFSMNFSSFVANVSILNALELFAAIIVWWMIFFFRFFRSDLGRKGASPLALIGATFGALLYYWFIFESIVGNFINRQKFAKILENIERYDQKVRRCFFKFIFID